MKTAETHPLLIILPVVRLACGVHGARCTVRRVLAQPVSIGVELGDLDFEVVLDDDIAKHRSFAMNGMWMETDAEQLDADLSAMRSSAWRFQHKLRDPAPG